MNSSEPRVSGTQRPARVFISHRHDDARIAHVLRQFLRRVTAGAVEVFQSSYEGGGPEIGKILSQELGRELAEAELVLLIYTVADENWSYCMWECGVAFDPRMNDTRIVVLQCGQAIPAPLNDRVRVRLDQEESVHRFVKKFMTDADFFPRRQTPITRFGADSPEVEDAARELIAHLKPVASGESEEYWPAWPWLRFELPLERALEIRSMFRTGQSDDAYTAIRSECFIGDNDNYAVELFGTRRFETNQTLGSLVTDWEKKNAASSHWATSLLRQIAKAICWEFPDPEWAVFKRARESTFYAPILFSVRKSPGKQRMQFDVQFVRFDLDNKTQLPKIQVAGD
jgi:hypothetical protein